MKYKTHFYPDRIFLGNISLLKKMSSSLQFEKKKRNGVNPWSFHTQTFLEEWLKCMGLKLHPDKTQIVNTRSGFQFIGFSFCPILLQELMKRGCLQVWGGDARNLLTSAFRTRIQEIFYSSSYPHFCPFGTRSRQRQQPPYILGNPSPPFANRYPLNPGTKHGYIYIYIYISFFLSFGTKVGIQTSQHHSRKSCPHSKVGRNYMNSFENIHPLLPLDPHIFIPYRA
jgi:hypothetical protein